MQPSGQTPIGYTATTSTPPGDSTLMYFYQSPVNITTYTATTSSGATESVSLGVNNSGSIDVAIKGTTTAGDIITLSATNPGASSPINVTYTVTSTDSLISIASNIAALINSNSSLQSFLLSASNTAPGNLLWSESFQTSLILSGGKNLVAVTGQDGSGNQKTNQFPLSTTTNAAQSLTYDLNGNMTSDGTNNYLWDAENRLIQINYPASGNNSQFAYDAFGHCVTIIETVSGAVTSTKQFVNVGASKNEMRDNSGAVIAQFFNFGEALSATNYYWTTDHLGSVREMITSTGAVVSEKTYDPFGKAKNIEESIAADFQYAAYYNHARSGLNLTVNRAYNANLGRWLNRDPIGESAGANLYAYVRNNSVSMKDPSGLGPEGAAIGGTIGGVVGGLGGLTLGGAGGTLAGPVGTVGGGYGGEIGGAMVGAGAGAMAGSAIQDFLNAMGFFSGCQRLAKAIQANVNNALKPKKTRCEEKAADLAAAAQIYNIRARTDPQAAQEQLVYDMLEIAAKYPDCP